jgi:uncharacterized membrane protein
MCAARSVMSERPSLRWPGLVGTAASVAGLAVSTYLTYEHYTGSTSLVCSNKGAIDCLKVTTSSYAEVGGVPVAVLGVIFFLVTMVLQLPAMWKRVEPAIRRGRVALAAVGLGTAAYLLYAELFRIDAICLWCTAVHVLTLVVFVSTVLATLSTASLVPGEPDRSKRKVVSAILR